MVVGRLECLREASASHLLPSGTAELARQEGSSFHARIALLLPAPQPTGDIRQKREKIFGAIFIVTPQSEGPKVLLPRPHAFAFLPGSA